MAGDHHPLDLVGALEDLHDLASRMWRYSMSS
jgi:hypothetical protein